MAELREITFGKVETPELSAEVFLCLNQVQKKGLLGAAKKACKVEFEACEADKKCPDDLYTAMISKQPPKEGSDSLMDVVRCIMRDVAKDRQRPKKIEPAPTSATVKENPDPEKYAELRFDGENFIPAELYKQKFGEHGTPRESEGSGDNAKAEGMRRGRSKKQKRKHGSAVA